MVLTGPPLQSCWSSLSSHSSGQAKYHFFGLHFLVYYKNLNNNPYYILIELMFARYFKNESHFELYKKKESAVLLRNIQCTK